MSSVAQEKAHGDPPLGHLGHDLSPAQPLAQQEAGARGRGMPGPDIGAPEFHLQEKVLTKKEHMFSYAGASLFTDFSYFGELTLRF